ncbi:MAG: hypothetical protein QOH52_1408 [Pseudonocardiales bacterium]|nr:hypothetical protein [Pseudonocardiales bacterium]
MFGQQYVDELAVLIDRPVQVGPSSGDLDIGFVDEPPIAGRVPGRAAGVDDLRGERLYPPLDRGVIDDDAAFGEQFFHVAVRLAVAQVPAQRQCDHLTRKAIAGRRG